MKAPGAGAAPAVELDGSDDVVRTYTWGLDLAGLHTANSGPGRRGYPTSGGFLQAAGGIGGLLAVYDAGEADGYVYFHDANGNVGQVVAWENGYGGANGDDWHADRLVGRYEYSPFGEVVGPDDDADGDWRDDAGAFATDNPFRFSTKWFDDAIGVSDFGARMYSATLGRFLNRDPIAEAGGVNLYAFAGNDPVNRVDPFGYHNIPGCGFGVTCPEYDAGAELVPALGGGGNLGSNCADMLCPTSWPATYCPTTGRCECPGAGCGGPTRGIGGALGPEPPVYGTSIAAGVGAIGAGYFFICAYPIAYTVRKLGYTNSAWAHCVASCEISRTCGWPIGLAAGHSREIADAIRSALGLGGVGFSWNDVGANREGRRCAGFAGWMPSLPGLISRLFTESCQSCCDRKYDRFGLDPDIMKYLE